MNNLLNIFNKNTHTPPIWLMRQAGRYMTEYMEIKKKFPDFFSMCKNIDAVYDITFQPIKKFNLDAAIIFSDILIILECLNINVKFVQGIGPVVQKFDIEKLEIFKEEQFDFNKIRNVYESISKLKKDLKNLKKPLIGFSAAPWTLATYLIEGQLTKEHVKIREIAYKSPDKLDKIIKLLSKLIIKHLENQIKYGVDIVQIFDTHANNMDNHLFDKYFLKEIKNIVAHLKIKFPHIPICLFSKSSRLLDNELYNYIDCISFNSHIRMKDYLEKIPNKVFFQGNLDPMRLVVGGKSMVKVIETILKDMENKNFIFNLGHGILPQTPIENVHLLVDTIRQFKR